MNRRQFVSSSGVVAALAGSSSEHVSAAPTKPVLMKLGCQSAPSNEKHFQYFARYGVRNICGYPETGDGRLYATVEELTRLRAQLQALPTREITVDGWERQFATNYLGPFALTALLLPSIKSQPGSRVVVVSSSVTKRAKIDFDNLQSERVYKPMWQAYAQAKLADSIFAFELQRRLTAAGSPIICTAAHPGYAITNLQVTIKGGFMGLITSILTPIASQDAAHGALPTLMAAVGPDVTPGGYYGPDRFFELKGYPVAVPIPKAAQDGVVARRLWDESEQLTGVSFGVLSKAARQRTFPRSFAEAAQTWDGEGGVTCQRS